jgi:hypothetical protein
MPQPGKYGRRDPDPTKPRLYLDDYFDAAHVAATLPAFNPDVNYAAKVSTWPMYINGPDPSAPDGLTSGIGDCTCAYAGHAIQAITAYSGTEVTITDQDVLAAYCAISGFVPGNESTDTGCQIQDVLNYWRTTGIGGHKIIGFGALRTWDTDNLNAALNLFWTVDLGVNLPQSAEAQFSKGEPWVPVRGAAIAGGHCIGLQAFTPSMDELHPVTWGALWKMNQAFNREYTQEAWVPIFPEVIAAAQQSGAIDLPALAADFTALTGEPFPAAT